MVTSKKRSKTAGSACAAPAGRLDLPSVRFVTHTAGCPAAALGLRVRRGLAAALPIVMGLLWLGHARIARADQPLDPRIEPAPLTAQQWLATVRERLPRRPTWITGWLSTDGHPMLNVEVLLDLGHDPPLARYNLRDAFGRDLEEITLWRGKELRQRYRRGAALEPAPAPDLFAPLRATAMSWGDLNLSFLWWDGGTIIGRGEVRGEECVVIEVTAPDTEAGIYDHARLWIHGHHRMLLQAEGFDVRGNRIRRMQVKSFRKIGEHWMVKDIEIRRYPGPVRTNLRVRDMGEAPEPAAAGDAVAPPDVTD